MRNQNLKQNKTKQNKTAHGRTHRFVDLSHVKQKEFRVGIYLRRKSGRVETHIPFRRNLMHGARDDTKKKYYVN